MHEVIFLEETLLFRRLIERNVPIYLLRYGGGMNMFLYEKNQVNEIAKLTKNIFWKDVLRKYRYSKIQLKI